jgi:hypothetical protein
MAGPFVGTADGYTAGTALSIAQAQVRLSKVGGAWGQKADAGTVAHTEAGYYSVPLGTADVDTPGRLVVAISPGEALPWTQVYAVMPGSVYDAAFGTAALPVDVRRWLGDVAPANSGDAYARIGASGSGLSAVALSAAGVDAVLDEAVEGTITFRQALKVTLAALAGKMSGCSSYAPVVRDVNDTKDRIRAVTSADGRTSVVLDVS